MSKPELAPTQAIIGSGGLGPVVARYLTFYSSPDHRPLIIDKNPEAHYPSEEYATPADSMEQVLGSDVIYLAAYLDDELLEQLEQVPETSTIVHFGSTQSKDRIALKKHGLLTKTLMTHPLLGPDSMDPKRKALAKRNEQGIPLFNKNIVVTTPIDALTDMSTTILDLWSDKGAILQFMTAEMHDRAMKQHAKAFFIGQSLKILDEIPRSDVPQLETPFIRSLREIERKMKGHSYELFRHIEEENPFAAEARDELVELFVALDNSLVREPFPLGVHTKTNERMDEVDKQMRSAIRTLAYAASRLVSSAGVRVEVAGRLHPARLSVLAEQPDILEAALSEVDLDIPIEEFTEFATRLIARGYDKSPKGDKTKHLIVEGTELESA